MSKCECCGQEYKLSKRDSMLRKVVRMQAKMFPALKEATEEAKNYCNDCWKKMVKPVAETLAGVKGIE